MSPELNERIAAMEPQLKDLKADVDDLHEFKDLVIAELAELNSNLKTLSWKVSLITGAAIVFGNKFLDLGMESVKKFLP